MDAVSYPLPEPEPPVWFSRQGLKGRLHRFLRRLGLAWLVLLTLGYTANLVLGRQLLVDPVELVLAAGDLTPQESRFLVWAQSPRSLTTFGELKEAVAGVLADSGFHPPRFRIASEAGELYRVVRYVGATPEGAPLRAAAVTLLPAGDDGQVRTVVSVAVGPGPGYRDLKDRVEVVGRSLTARVGPARRALVVRAAGRGLPAPVGARERLMVERMLAAVDGRVVREAEDGRVAAYSPRLPSFPQTADGANLTLRVARDEAALRVEVGVPDLDGRLEPLLHI